MFGILITAYQQVDFAEQQINYIRNQYKVLNDIPIIIVTTSEIDVGFKKLEKYKKVYVVELKNAPGSEGSKFVTKSNPPCADPPGGYWRYCYLAARILYAMQHGFWTARTLEITELVHLHTDTYWEADKEMNLVNDLINVRDEKLLFIGDVPTPVEVHKKLPPEISFCPEGMVFNLKECYQYRYGFTFDDIYKTQNSQDKLVNGKQFYCTDYMSFETLSGQYAIWCLAKQNIFGPDSKVPQIFRDKVKTRLLRTHHGKFESGLINIETHQPKGNLQL